MNRAMTAPVLEPVGEGKVALQSVNVEAEIENLLCQVTVKQSYRNLEKINIEAVYTFPLPLGAVLLDMTIKTRTKELKGVVVEKSEAEDRYEDAITDGDTAIMLEQVEPGLYTMNVGNLQPEDTIDISITYAELFKWRDNSLRFFLPTTISPRYGDPDSLGVQPHQTPEYDLTNENPFTITLSILGALSAASIESPSHKIVSERQDGKTIISLKKGEALMDRDFILNLVMEADEKSVAHLESDGEGHIALASFYPRFPSVSDNAPRCITIIVDCSGSMGGDSIAQARKALYEILELLRPEDTFNVVRFGSSHQMLFPAPVPADAGNLKKAKNLLEILDADMGGTEIGQAIFAAIKGKTPGKMSKEALLITDGEVWDWEKVTAMVAKSGYRFFTVGVGSSVSEAFVQTLADNTGGACELVSPHEDMAEKIVRHFKRIYFPKAMNVKIRWPGEPDKTFPEHIGSVYDGDTLHVFGRFKERPDGDVELRAELENGGTFVQKLPLQVRRQAQTPTELPGTTARMAAACEIRTMEDPKEIAALGEKYQLMSRFTNYLAIYVKAEGEKAGEPIPRVEYYLPEIYEEYLVYRKKVHHTPYRKRKQIKRVLAAFHDYLKKHKQGLRTLKIDHIDAFHAKFNPAFALRSQQLYRYYLRGFMSYLYHQRGWLKKDLAALMKGPPVYTRAKPPKFLRRKQLFAVFDNLSGLTAIGLRTYAMIHLAYFLGLRPQEIVKIRLSDISFKGAELILEDRKNNIPTKLPLPERVVKAVAAYIIGGRPKSKSQLLFVGHLPPYGPVAAARVSCDLSACLQKVNRKATGYWLRRTYAQNLLEAGASYYDIKEMLGHDHIESTKQYLSIHIEMMRKVLFDETL